MKNSEAMRHIGMDLGTMNARVCYTNFNRGQQQFDDPVAVVFGNEPALRTFVLLDAAGQQALAFGDDIVRMPQVPGTSEYIQADFMARLGADAAADKSLELFLRHLYQQLLSRALNADDLGAESTVTSVGVQAKRIRSKDNQYLQFIKRAVESAGFPAVTIVPEPIGALLYHKFLGDVQILEAAQQWVVIDVGSQTTDITVVQKNSGHDELIAIGETFSSDVGGRNFDSVLLEKIILPCWTGPTPTSLQRIELARFTKELKESFSKRVMEGQTTCTRSSTLEQLTNPITMTRGEFEAQTLAGPLISQLDNILRNVAGELGSLLDDVDQVILTGGSSQWYFVKDSVARYFGQKQITQSSKPDLTVARGLALAQTGFKVAQKTVDLTPPLIAKNESPLVPVTVAPPIAKAPDPGQALLSSLRAKARESRATTLKYALVSAVIAGIIGLQPIPGISRLILPFVEARLIKRISEIYGRPLSVSQYLSIFIACFILGGIIGTTIDTVLIPFIGIEAIPKALVATVIMYGLGEAAIYYFKERSQ